MTPAEASGILAAELPRPLVVQDILDDAQRVGLFREPEAVKTNQAGLWILLFAETCPLKLPVPWPFYVRVAFMRNYAHYPLPPNQRNGLFQHLLHLTLPSSDIDHMVVPDKSWIQPKQHPRWSVILTAPIIPDRSGPFLLTIDQGRDVALYASPTNGVYECLGRLELTTSSCTRIDLNRTLISPDGGRHVVLVWTEEAATSCTPWICLDLQTLQRPRVLWQYTVTVPAAFLDENTLIGVRSDGTTRCWTLDGGPATSPFTVPCAPSPRMHVFRTDSRLHALTFDRPDRCIWICDDATAHYLRFDNGFIVTAAADGDACILVVRTPLGARVRVSTLTASSYATPAAAAADPPKLYQFNILRCNTYVPGKFITLNVNIPHRECLPMRIMKERAPSYIPLGFIGRTIRAQHPIHLAVHPDFLELTIDTEQPVGTGFKGFAIPQSFTFIVFYRRKTRQSMTWWHGKPAVMSRIPSKSSPYLIMRFAECCIRVHDWPDNRPENRRFCALSSSRAQRILRATFVWQYYKIATHASYRCWLDDSMHPNRLAPSIISE